MYVRSAVVNQSLMTFNQLCHHKPDYTASPFAVNIIMKSPHQTQKHGSRSWFDYGWLPPAADDDSVVDESDVVGLEAVTGPRRAITTSKSPMSAMYDIVRNAWSIIISLNKMNQKIFFKLYFSIFNCNFQAFKLDLLIYWKKKEIQARKKN